MESFKFESVLALQQKKNSIRLDIQPGGVLSLLYRKLLSSKAKNALRGCALRRIRLDVASDRRRHENVPRHILMHIIK